MKKGCYKCGGKIHETGGVASSSQGMSQEDQMLMMIASMLQKNISKLGQEEGVQATIQFLGEKGLIDPNSQEGMQQGMSLLEASINHVDQVHGSRDVSSEGLPEYTSGGYDDMKDGGSFSPHEMYKGDDVQMARSYQEHLDLAERGYDHNMAKGGEMIRRADGSYSRRGFWDNIRATEKKLKKAQVGQQQEEQSMFVGNQGVPVENQPASPMMGAMTFDWNNPQNNITTPNQQYSSTTSNLEAGEAFKPENFKQYETIEDPDEDNVENNDENINSDDEKKIGDPVKSVTYHRNLGVQEATPRDVRRMGNLSYNVPGNYNSGLKHYLSVQDNPLAQLASGFLSLRGIGAGLGLAGKKFFNSPTMRQDYDAEDNKVGDPYEVDRKTIRQENKDYRQDRRALRQYNRLEDGNPRNDWLNKVENSPQNLYYKTKGMFQKEDGGELIRAQDGTIVDWNKSDAIVTPKTLKNGEKVELLFDDHDRNYIGYEDEYGDWYRVTKEHPQYKEFKKAVRPDFRDQQFKNRMKDKYVDKVYTGKNEYTPSQEFTDRLNYQIENKGLEKGMGDTDKLEDIAAKDLGLLFGPVAYSAPSERYSKKDIRRDLKKRARLEHGPQWYAANALENAGILEVPYRHSRKEGGEWNPFEDNRRKIKMNIHKPMFVNGGQPMTLQEWLGEDKSRAANPNYQAEYDAYVQSWNNNQGQPVADNSVVFDNNSNTDDPSDNSDQGKDSQNNSYLDSLTKNKRVTEYGTDDAGSYVAEGITGGLEGVAGVTEYFAEKKALRDNNARLRQSGNTMLASQPMNPQDAWAGKLAQEFSVSGFGTPMSGGMYSLGKFEDIGTTYATSKRGGQIYELGGVYDLTDEELAMLKAMGYEYDTQ